MKINKIFLVMLLFGAASTQATFNNWLNRENRCRYDFDCCVDALECGAIGIQLQGGIYPIKWHKRTDNLLVNCLGSPTAPVTTITNVGGFAKFSNLYKLPWTIGVQLSYAFSCNTNVFVEFNYAQSSGTKCNFCSSVNPAFILTLSKYKLWNAFAGMRYYFDRCCDRVSPFIGAKVGVVHHKKALFNSIASSTLITAYTNTNFFASNNVIAGGGHIGLDICGLCGFNFVLTAEVIANCGPRVVPNVLLSAADVARLNGRVLLPGHIRTELAFPITLGIKYNF